MDVMHKQIGVPTKKRSNENLRSKMIKFTDRLGSRQDQ